MTNLFAWIAVAVLSAISLAMVVAANGTFAGHRADPFPKLREAHEARQEFEATMLVLENELLAGRVDTVAKARALAIASRHSDSLAMTDQVISLVGHE